VCFLWVFLRVQCGRTEEDSREARTNGGDNEAVSRGEWYDDPYERKRLFRVDLLLVTNGELEKIGTRAGLGQDIKGRHRSDRSAEKKVFIAGFKNAPDAQPLTFESAGEPNPSKEPKD